MAYYKYPEEFKKEAVKLALESDANIGQIAINLGINERTLQNWLDKSMKEKSSIPGKTADYKSRYQEVVNENTQLKKALKRAKMEREILKKAAAYFASQNL